MDRGSWGEGVAERCLRGKRYHILHRNWRAERGEIDLIALEKETLVFVEVKTRSQCDPIGGYPAATGGGKRRALRRSCGAFLQKYRERFPHFRFDVIEILTPRRSYRAEQIFHHENVPLFAQ
jgi:putative endonuclease